MSKLPIVSGLRELDPAPRSFLLFIVFNVVSWQCIIGPVLVLFARKIGMPPSWVGFLIAFTPISMVLVVATGLMVMRFGSKPVMFASWMLRNLVTCVVFLMPWAISHGGMRTAWYVLMTSTLGFCLMRALGAGGWFPWLHEVVPPDQRGVYFSTEASVTQLLNVIVSLLQALVLHGDPGLYRFLFVYGIGVAAGLMSLVWMYRVPGGRGSRGRASLKADFASYRRAWGDRPFLGFVLIVSLCFASMSWLGASSVLFMRDALGIASGAIMLITAVCSVSVMLTVRHWARFAEHSGSALAMGLTQSGHALAALLCLLLIPGAWWTPYTLWAVLIFASTCGSAFWMTANRAMLGYVQESSRVGYTNIWNVGTAIALGITPILAGMAIDRWNLFGFRTCFVMAGLGGLACAVAARLTVRDAKAPDRPERTFAPLRPMRAAGQIFLITLGLHESNR